MIRITGLRNNEKDAIDRHNSQSVHGPSYVGTLLDAMTNGFCEGFQGKVFYDSAAIGTPVQVTATASKTYIMQNCNQYFQVLTDATGAGAAAGIPDASAATSRGSLNLYVTDAPDNGIGYTQADQLWIAPVAPLIQMSIEMASISNADQLNTISLGQFGVMTAKGANFLVVDGLDSALTNKPANDFAFIEFSNSKCRIVTLDNASATAITASPWVDYPTGQSNVFTLNIRAGKTIELTINNNRTQAVIVRSGVLGATQLFGRVGHAASYVALTHAPIQFNIDSLLCSVPLASN